MIIINTSPDRPIQLGYEGEDRVTVLRFRYGKDWLENGEGVFNIRVRRHGESQAYNAQLLTVDLTHMELLMTVTNVELSVKGSGEMQVVYSGSDFVKKSPIYSYNVSRAVDEAVDPPAQDVYTQIIESLSDLQTDVQGLTDAVDGIGNLADLTTTAKTDLVSAINEVNAKGGGGGSVTVDDALSTTSMNPVQNKAITGALAGKADKSLVDVLADDVADVKTDTGALKTAMQSKADIQTVSALSDAVNGLDSDVQGLQTAIQGKADTATVTALSGTVSGLQTAVQSKADAQTVTALSGTVTGLQTSKADKSYVDTQLATKASTATATASSDGLMSSADKSKLDAIGSVVTVSGTTPVITAVSGVRYVCGEVATLDFTPCATGICDVVFTSGSTPTVVTLPNTVKFPDGSFTAEANKTYEINIMDGAYGVVMSWT